MVRRGWMCHSIGVVLVVGFFLLLFAFHIFRQVMVHAWRQTLTDTELSKSHEFDVVRNLRAFDAGCLQRQGSWYGCCLTVFVSMGTSWLFGTHQLKSDVFIGLRLVDYLLQISSNFIKIKIKKKHTLMINIHNSSSLNWNIIKHVYDFIEVFIPFGCFVRCV